MNASYKKGFLSSYKKDKNDRHISDEEYLHLQNAWDTFNLINLTLDLRLSQSLFKKRCIIID